MKKLLFDGGYDFNKRRSNEVNSFITASMLLNEHTDKQYVYELASINDDNKKGIDIYWGPETHPDIRYNINVRERIYTPKENGIYKNTITVRANDEMKKIVNNIHALVHIRRDINKKLYGYSIISVAAMIKEIYMHNCCDFDNDDLWYKKLPWLTRISYSSVHNDFYSLNVQKMPPEMVLAHINF